MTGRSAFWRWRHARPFWGGLFVFLGGAEILLTEKAPLPVILHIGMTGLAGYLVPAMLLVCGVLLLVNPEQRLFYSIVAALLALGSWITSNLGGFFVGLLLALVGAALAFGWSPTKHREQLAEHPDGQQTGAATPDGHPDTSPSPPRHSGTLPGWLSGE